MDINDSLDSKIDGCKSQISSVSWKEQGRDSVEKKNHKKKILVPIKGKVVEQRFLGVVREKVVGMENKFGDRFR